MKNLVKHFKLYKKTLLISVLSFALGYLYNNFIGERLHVDEKDIYCGKSASYRSKNEFPDVFLVILIFSSLNNFSRREVIRNTWLSDVKSEEIVHFFAISAGTATSAQKSLLKLEQEKNGDLLIFTNLDDSFYLLTTKLIASFDWLTDVGVLREEVKSSTRKRFRKFEFLLKCDDDTFVRVTDLVSELKTVYSGERGENLYLGFFDGRAKPKKTGKYKEDQWIVCDYYIPYALGGGYVLARPLVHFIARNGNFLTRYRNEDISVGAWLSSYSKLNRVHDPRFDTEYISRGCHQSYLVTHKHSEFAMKKFHENLKVTGKLCLKENRTRISYMYNWNVPPSKCCSRNNPDIP